MFEKNILALKKVSPNTIFFINESIKKEKEKVKLLKTSTGEYSLKVKIQERELLVHSKRDPEKEAQRFVEKIKNTDGNFIVIYGMGLGYHVREIFKEIILEKSDAKLLVIEPSGTIFKEAVQLFDFSDIILHSRVGFAIGRDEDEMREQFSKLFKMYENDNIKVFEFNVYRRIFPEFFQKIDVSLKNALSVGVSNYTTVINYIDEWHGNILENLGHIVKSAGIIDYQSQFKNKPAIVISAGPSLDKNGIYLKQAKGKAILIAVDTAVKPLLSMGIEPDVVVSVDSQYVNFKHLEGVELPNAYCLCSPIVYPEVPKMFEGRCIFFNFYFQLSLWLESYLKTNGILFTGGSVATVAFDFARKIGADPIVFVGQDLAFTGNYNHCVETYGDKEFFNDLSRDYFLQEMHANQIIDAKKTRVKTLDIYGREIITYRVLDDYCKWIEYECGKTSGTMINATEGGILKENVVNMRLKDVINEYLAEEIDINSIIVSNFNILSKKDLYDFYKLMGQVNDNISFIKTNAFDCIKDVEKLYKKLKNNEKDSEYQKKAIKIEKMGLEMEKRIQIGTFIVEKFQTQYWPVLRKLNQNSHFKEMGEDEQTLEKLKIKYETLDKIANDLYEPFNKAQKKVKEYLKKL